MFYLMFNGLYGYARKPDLGLQRHEAAGTYKLWLGFVWYGMQRIDM
jgi:hypothetical protein